MCNLQISQLNSYFTDTTKSILSMKFFSKRVEYVIYMTHTQIWKFMITIFLFHQSCFLKCDKTFTGCIFHQGKKIESDLNNICLNIPESLLLLNQQPNSNSKPFNLSVSNMEFVLKNNITNLFCRIDCFSPHDDVANRVLFKSTLYMNVPLNRNTKIVGVNQLEWC